MASWLDLLMGGQAPVMAGPPDQQPSSPFVPQQMVQPPVFARAPQLAEDVAAGVAQPLLGAGNYLGGLMQGSQQFNWPDVIQHGAALAMAMAPGPKGERIGAGLERGLAEALAARGVTPEGLAIPGAAFKKTAAQAMEDVQALPKGSGPMDLTSAPGVPVAQTPLERYVPPRGVSARVQDALQNPDVHQGVSDSIQKGIELGADKWYHNDAINRSFVDTLGPDEGPQAFRQYMQAVGATSPRSDVPTNIRNASYYYTVMQNHGVLPEQLPYPYGHVAQNLHRQNFENIRSGTSAGAAATGGIDVLQNPKPPSFIENLTGNLEPGTIDTHAFRNVGMRTQDPRFLATSITDIARPNAGPESLQARFGELNDKGDKVTYRPQKLFNEGKLTMDELQKMPAFWDSQPKANEYAAIENFYRDMGRKHGLPTADAQAAAWAGGGDLTGLGTTPDKTFAQMMNERVLYTAKVRGEDPKDTLRLMIQGKKPLLGIGGAIPLAAAPVFAPRDQQQ
jgi:hypothetical protein